MKTIEALHNDAPLTDVHLHPSLKAWLFRRNLWRHYSSGKGMNPFSSRCDFKSLSKGGVGVIWAAHYLPERELFEQCWVAKTATRIVIPKANRLWKGSQFKRLNEMIDAMEREVNRKPDRTAVARSVTDLKAIRTAGKIAVVHTVEGAHSLEKNADNVDKLAARGVAMITLAHFFRNDLAQHIDGMPPDIFVRKLCKWDFGLNYAATDPAVTPEGMAILKRMEQKKMVVDLTHCSFAAREKILDELAPGHPVVMSHSGVDEERGGLRNPTDDEIRKIAARHGVIGIIFMTFWLADNPTEKGLDLIWKNMKHVRDVTGDWDHVAIGTDFDGFTDPTDDVKDSSQMANLTNMLRGKGLSDDDLEKVLGKNALRVLEKGWV